MSSLFRRYNIGNNDSVELMDCIAELEKDLGETEERNFLCNSEMPLADRYAFVHLLVKEFDYKPLMRVV